MTAVYKSSLCAMFAILLLRVQHCLAYFPVLAVPSLVTRMLTARAPSTRFCLLLAIVRAFLRASIIVLVTVFKLLIA